MNPETVQSYENIFKLDSTITFIEISTYRICRFTTPYNPKLFGLEDRVIDNQKCKCLVLIDKTVDEIFEADMPFIYCVDRNLNVHILNTTAYMFAGAIRLKRVNCSRFNTSRVTRMDYMFADCYSINTIDCGSWDTGLVYSFSNMFASCTNLRLVYTSKWDIRSLRVTRRMFYQCVNLDRDHISINDWDMSNLTDISEMFKDSNVSRYYMRPSVPPTCSQDMF